MGKLNLIFIIRKRKEYGLSLQEMALMLGFKNAFTYLKYENGCYSFKADMLPILSKAFRCDMKNFFIN